MDNSVILKGNPYGISVIINEGGEYKTIKDRVLSKFKDSEGFFKGASVGISFEGDVHLPDNYQLDLLNSIADNTCINVVCLIDRSQDTVCYYKDIVEAAGKEAGSDEYKDYCTVIRDNIREENSVTSPLGIMVIGSVLPSGRVTSDNDVYIMGTASGTVTAGAPDNTSAVVYAGSFDNCDLTIGGISKRNENSLGSFFRKLKKSKNMIKAYVENDLICFEEVKQEL